MQLIQILLPIINTENNDLSTSSYAEIRKELTERFGGITSYTRSPATGLWKEKENKTIKDDIIIYEVMAENVDRDWWKQYKKKLEQIFKQEEIIIRAWTIELL